jgi:hypothetical protein
MRQNQVGGMDDIVASMSYVCNEIDQLKLQLLQGESNNGGNTEGSQELQSQDGQSETTELQEHSGTEVTQSEGTQDTGC